MTIEKGLKVASQILHVVNPTSIKLKNDLWSLLYSLLREFVYIFVLIFAR